MGYVQNIIDARNRGPIQPSREFADALAASFLYEPGPYLSTFRGVPIRTVMAGEVNVYSRLACAHCGNSFAKRPNSCPGCAGREFV